MSVYKTPKSPYFHYSFRLAGRRFHGTTRQVTRRLAEKVEAQARREAQLARDAERAAGTGPMTVSQACARYWTEVGQYHSAALTTRRNLERLVAHFGDGRRLDTIADADLAAFVAQRRTETAHGRKTIRDLGAEDPKAKKLAPVIAPATVNRTAIEPLQRVMNRARTLWGQVLPKAPNFNRHKLLEPQERCREVRGHEEALIAEAVRADYQALVRFSRLSGLRQAECLLRKDEVDLVAKTIRVPGKGGRMVTRPITAPMRRILMEEMANATDYVFTYIAHRAKQGAGGHPKGARLPITPSGLKSLWRRAKGRRDGPRLPADLRFHDMRHDFGTKLLRLSGNLKLVQKALGHARIETTMRYAHVLDEEVAAGMERLGEQMSSAFEAAPEQAVRSRKNTGT